MTPKELYNRINDLRVFRGRMLSRKPRLLPHFLVIGAPRSGTTTLFRHLVQHPDVEAPLRKEIHFFDRHFERGIAWYRLHFPAADPKSSTYTGEGTPTYLYAREAPRRVADLLPNVRVIILLRNPIDRAYSSYHWMVSEGAEHESFEHALRREFGILAAGHEQDDAAVNYISRGLYHDHVKRWMEHIDSSRLLIVRSEDFYRDSGGVFGTLTKFLQLDSWVPPKFKVHNQGSYTRLGAHHRAELGRFFREPTRQLERLTGIEFDWD